MVDARKVVTLKKGLKSAVWVWVLELAVKRADALSDPRQDRLARQLRPDLGAQREWD